MIGTGSGARAVGRTTSQRLLYYYAVLAGVVALVQWLVPARTEAVAQPLPTTLPEALRLATEWRDTVMLPSWTVAVLLSVVAVLMAIPFSLVYVRTRTSDTYDRSLVHTVLALPLITTTIVVVVRDSLSLAFSLAGIVAAVRFRNNLKESRDAIYIFASIGIGFASGVGALPVALGLSLCFCLLELWQWKYGIGGEHDSTHRLLCGPPLDLQASLKAFDLPPATISATIARAAAGAPVVRAEDAPVADADKPPVPQVRVRLRLTQGAGARGAVEQALGELVKKAVVLEAPVGPPAALELLLRPRRKLQGGALHAAIAAIPGVVLESFEPLRDEPSAELRVAAPLTDPVRRAPAFVTHAPEVVPAPPPVPPADGR